MRKGRKQKSSTLLSVGWDELDSAGWGIGSDIGDSGAKERSIGKMGKIGDVLRLWSREKTARHRGNLQRQHI